MVVGLALTSATLLLAAFFLGFFAIFSGAMAFTIPSPPAPPGAALAMTGDGSPRAKGARERAPSRQRQLAIAGIILGAVALLVPVAILVYYIAANPVHGYD